MAPFHSVVKAAAVALFLLPTAFADTLNRTMCYCSSPSGEMDTLVEAGAYYIFQYHSNAYNIDISIDYTCRSANYDNICTMRWQQQQKRCRTIDGGWEFCYDQNPKKLDRYSFMGVRHGVGGLIVNPPQGEVEQVCDNLCLKHVGLPRIPKAWDVSNLVGHIIEWRGDSIIDIFPELPDIVLPKRGYAPKLRPGSDNE